MISWRPRRLALPHPGPLRRDVAAVGLAAVTGAVLLTACAPTQAHPGRALVVTGLYPFAFVAQQVGGNHVDVVNLTPPGAEPHDLELSPRQVAQVVDAAVIVNLPGFQPALDDAITQNGDPAKVLDVSKVVSLRPVTTSSGETATTAAGTAADPHVWLDPVRMIAVSNAFADRLASVDPPDAAAYRANANTLDKRLRQLDAEFRNGLQDCRITTIVTNHAAFGYLAARYGLQVVSISGLDPEVEPSPQQLADVVATARDAGVTTVFAETLANPAAADALARELGASVATLNPVEGLTAESTDDYFSLMRKNLATLMQANQCTGPTPAAAP